MGIMLLCAVTLFTCVSLSRSIKSWRKFPDGFIFGAATSAYQVEGAWNESGKSESIWDHHTHTLPDSSGHCHIKDCTNGDVADDSYHLYKKDVELVKDLGLNFYRFSLSWTRIMPTSFPDKINEAAVQYYNALIDELIKNDIMPMVTIFHWDLPHKLQQMGGWTNPNIVDWYADYARTVFELFGDRVKFWVTINEPYLICNYGYGDTEMAPGLNIKGIAEYACAKNVLMAHAKAYHIYNDKFRGCQEGTIGLSISAQNYEPVRQKPEDIVAADEMHQFTWEQYAHPIFSKEGDFPQIMKEKIAAKSKQQGFARSRLPKLSRKEIRYIRGTSDFFGLNHYDTYLVNRSNPVNNYEKPSFMDDLSVNFYQPDEWKNGVVEFVTTVPWGFYNLLKRIKKRYSNPPIYVTENGYATSGGLNDASRIQYLVKYLNAMMDAMDEGSDVKGYTVWSLLDNFEWSEGYTQCFGLYEVNHTDPKRTRTPRESAFVYKEIVRTRKLIKI